MKATADVKTELLAIKHTTRTTVHTHQGKEDEEEEEEEEGMSNKSANQCAVMNNTTVTRRCLYYGKPPS